MPKGTLVTDITELKINLDANLMSKENEGTTYYATESGVPVTETSEGSGKYVLATASLDKSGLSYDCTYSYKISATNSPKEIYDGSAVDVKVKITGNNGYTETYTLAQLLVGEQVYSGKIKGLTYGTNQKIYIEAYVENTNKTQDDLAGNSFKFTIKLVENSFSCDLALDIEKEAKGKKIAQFLVNNNKRIDNLWSSGLDGDGYRYTGTGILCSYDNGNYIIEADNQYTIPSCSTLYNYTQTSIKDGKTSYYTYYKSCPSDTSTYTYSCTEITGTIDSKNVPNNFICFGTSDKTECKNNEAKYLYRVIGVFSDSNGKDLKLINFKQLTSTTRHSSSKTDTSWENSSLFTSLNGSGFLTNSIYDYLQNSMWLNKIENWQWTAVNTKTSESSGLDYYSDASPREIYLHEMNRTSKTSPVGEWTTPVAKIGLMYVSDYTLSLGNNALSITDSTGESDSLLKTGWMHQSHNDMSKYFHEWTLSRLGVIRGDYYVWSVSGGGYVDVTYTLDSYRVRPVFYLTSDVTYKSGTGTYSNPYIINE